MKMIQQIYLGFFLSILCVVASAAEDFQTGDIIFQTSKSTQSLAIQKATHSPYSHMGMLVYKSGQLWVLEAVQPVKYTPFQQWVNRGVGQRYTVKRLYKNLNPVQQQKLQIAAEQYLGQPYDLYFEWSDRSIYCSEIVWKAYNQALNIQLAPLQQLKDFDLSDPAVKKLMQQRYGKNIPLQEKVISPDALLHSKYLITVKSK
ncbi:YiiX family permuted papain-like enzyme [Acinetobacter gerneri]|uniref:YiiX family permuted papain-like enzyme n=1 Tax=Acinetobacter gerneri TaxID=202952 RepID=UPI0029365D80|nr:YiiX family permuted papain-like enzyme [Acinetobacter gerneri]MDV2438504.1 YiiX family permuted papain-like enzyme [Acinetobacter gerneri]